MRRVARGSNAGRREVNRQAGSQRRALKLISHMYRVGAIGVAATASCMVVSAAASSASSATVRAPVRPKITTYRLPEDSNPGGVVKGPDGNLWATEKWAGVIDRLTPSGELTPYRLDGLNGFPNYITVGADHALWFTVEPNEVDDTGQGIGRITTSGQFSFWPIPTIFGSPDSPQGIVAGPRDTLWFTFHTKKEGGVGAGGIGRVTLSDPGKVTAFSLGPHSGPLTIVRGRDRTFWFTEETADRIGSITTSGTIRTYPADGHPFGLTASPAGGFWFTEYQGNRVGQITPDGHVTQCPTFGPLDTFPTFILRKNGYFWLFQSGDPESSPAVEAHLTAMDYQCRKQSWALPDGHDTSPWYLGSGAGESLAFTQGLPDAVGRITFDAGATPTIR